MRRSFIVLNLYILFFLLLLATNGPISQNGIHTLNPKPQTLLLGWQEQLRNLEREINSYRLNTCWLAVGELEGTCHNMGLGLRV